MIKNKKMISLFKVYVLAFCVGFAFSAVPNLENSNIENNYSSSVSRSENALPTDPILDRAKGYLLQGKLKSAITNYGSIVDGFSHHPGGLWGEYSYFPSISFMYSIPGHKYSHLYEWELYQTGLYAVWKSIDAGEGWTRLGDSVFVDFVFNVENDKGDLGKRFGSHADFNSTDQWSLEVDDDGNTALYITTASELVNPNFQEAKMGLVYPWAKRAKFVERDPEVLYDFYDYGPDAIPWNEDDNYVYYGANTNESWFTRYSDNSNSDWQPKYRARENTHDPNATVGDIFGDATDFTDSGDPYPILAHSSFSETWPSVYNDELGEYEREWPGWWAERFDSSLTGCSGDIKDDDCWIEEEGSRFISDTDVYMEFDDRWAHQGNYVKTSGDEYQNTGYPLGLTVRMEAHSYGVSFAEDIMFITVRVRNDSGDYVNEDGEFVEGMVMPDGSQINGGKGFNYERSWMGFYVDVDAVWADRDGGMSNHSNADDNMGYFRDKPDGGDDSLSFAYIYDLDGVSNSATNLARAAVQLLDSPRLPWYEDNLDLNQDGNPDIFPGDKLGMTDWHWFDWYNRPGVRSRESNSNCCDGSAARPSAENREEIQYKVMAGDTVNISDDEQLWFFHTKDPNNEVSSDINPHFDSLEGLDDTQFWNDGMDCVLIMSTGPFELKVGEEKPFSFCVIMGADSLDLEKNAQFAQIMYDSHYQGFTAPDIPILSGTSGHEKVSLYWENNAESSLDVVTRYADFEGYKLYKSDDGGVTWGDPIVVNGVQVGWEPIAQWDLSAEEDINHCIYENGTDCEDNLKRGAEVSGYDPTEGNEWFYLGSNTGLQYTYVDTNVFDGVEYTYSLTSYDTGVLPPYINTYIQNDDGSYTLDQESIQSNPDKWADPDGAAALESARGTTILDPNFVKITPGHQASNYSEPDLENGDKVFVPSDNNLGTGDQFYRVANPYQFEDDLLRFEILASLGSDDLEGFKTSDPKMYSYIVNESGVANNVESYNLNDIDSDSLSVLSLLPGSYLDTLVNDDESVDYTIKVPNYVMKGYDITNEINYTDVYAGLAFGITNLDSYADLQFNQIGSMQNVAYDEFPGILDDVSGVFNSDTSLGNVYNSYLNIYDSYEEFNQKSGLSTNEAGLTFIAMEYLNKNTYDNHPSFDYRIEFSNSLFLDASNSDDCLGLNGVWNETSNECYYSQASSTVQSGCDEDVLPILPFRVYNVFTGKQVKLRHTDAGPNNDYSYGARDCVWQPNERITFMDSVRVGNNTSYSTLSLFNVYLNYNPDVTLAQTSDSYYWYPGSGPYEIGDITYYNGQEFIYTSEDQFFEEPGVFGDSDGDSKPDNYASSFNAWIPYYPWHNQDYLILSPKKQYVDGDYWTVDLSEFGVISDVSETNLEEIKVVPNPYIVRSGFNNESEYLNTIRFTHLPTECTIKIYTVSGEFVNEIVHNDIVDGNEYWNLRNRFNQLVAPGLYIYAVESGDKKHLGKFAIVR